MVKMPKFDDLKKMGAGFIDSAKTVNLGGVVDKFKTGMDSMGMKKTVEVYTGDDPLNQLIQDMTNTITELNAGQQACANLTKRLQSQLANVVRIAETYEKPTVAVQPEPPVVPGATSYEDENK